MSDIDLIDSLFAGEAEQNKSAPEPVTQEAPVEQQNVPVEEQKPVEQPTEEQPTEESKAEEPVVHEPAKEQVVKIDPEQLKLLVAQQQQAVSQQPAQAGPAFTQEEFDQATKAFKISKQHLQSIGVADPSDELVLNFQKNLVEPIVSNAESRAILMMQAMQKQQNEKLEQQVRAMSAYIESKAKDDVKTQFYGKYPVLKDYEEFVGFVASKNPKATLDEVAQNTVQLLNRAGNKISLNSQTEATQKKEATHSAVPQMNKMQWTGRSNATSQTTKNRSPQVSLIDEIFGQK